MHRYEAHRTPVLCLQLLQWHRLIPTFAPGTWGAATTICAAPPQWHEILYSGVPVIFLKERMRFM
jgi:hypothetical protein